MTTSIRLVYAKRKKACRICRPFKFLSLFFLLLKLYFFLKFRFSSLCLHLSIVLHDALFILDHFIDGARGDRDVRAPDVVEELLAGQDPTGPAHEVLQQRAYPHVIKFLNYANGKRNAVAIVS